MTNRILSISIFILMLFSFCTEQINKEVDMNSFDKFRAKEKFVEDIELMYPGIEDETYRKEYCDKINLIADDFEEVAKNNSTDSKYVEQIKAGLERFGDRPDTEDRERICMYIEELMDMVGLQSSDGVLNDYMYGFDPN